VYFFFSFRLFFSLLPWFFFYDTTVLFLSCCRRSQCGPSNLSLALASPLLLFCSSCCPTCVIGASFSLLGGRAYLFFFFFIFSDWPVFFHPSFWSWLLLEHSVVFLFWAVHPFENLVRRLRLFPLPVRPCYQLVAPPFSVRRPLRFFFFLKDFFPPCVRSNCFFLFGVFPQNIPHPLSLSFPLGRNFF